MSFSYTLVSSDTLRNGRKNYILFCPIDDPLYQLTTTNSDIVITQPKLPGFFLNVFPLQLIFSYALSDRQGNLVYFQIDTQSLTGSAPVWSNVGNNLTPIISANSGGRQRMAYNIVWAGSDINLDLLMVNGYGTLDIQMVFPFWITSYLVY